MDHIRYICRVEYVPAAEARHLFFDHHQGEVLHAGREAWQDAHAVGLSHLQVTEQADSLPRTQTLTLTARLRCKPDTRRPMLYRLTDASGERYVVACGMMNTFRDDELTSCDVPPYPTSTLQLDLPTSAGGDGRPQLTVTLTAERTLWHCAS